MGRSGRQESVLSTLLYVADHRRIRVHDIICSRIQVQLEVAYRYVHLAACRHVVPVYAYRGDVAVIVVVQGDRLVAAVGRDLDVSVKVERLDESKRPVFGCLGVVERLSGSQTRCIGYKGHRTITASRRPLVANAALSATYAYHFPVVACLIVYVVSRLPRHLAL